jgi:hypothetical protein
MFNFEIRAGVPAKKNTSGRHSEFPFAAMGVGTYFEVPAEHPKAQTKNTNRVTPVQQAAYNFGRNNKMKFVTERLESGAVRVYRTE